MFIKLNFYQINAFDDYEVPIIIHRIRICTIYIVYVHVLGLLYYIRALKIMILIKVRAYILISHVVLLNSTEHPLKFSRSKSSLFSSGDYNGWWWWFWRPRVKFLFTPKTGDGKTSKKFPEALCRINKTHPRDLFNGRVHIIIMCKHPTWLSPWSTAPACYTTAAIHTKDEAYSIHSTTIF